MHIRELFVGEEADYTPYMFLAGVIALYVILLPITPATVEKATSRSIAILKALALPFLAVYAVFVVLEFVEPRKLTAFLSELAGWKLMLGSITAGIISMGPIYMWYPLLARLKKKGLKSRYIAAFLYARAVKLPLLPVFAFYFGWPFALAFSAVVACSAVVVGYATEWLASAEG